MSADTNILTALNAIQDAEGSLLGKGAIASEAMKFHRVAILALRNELEDRKSRIPGEELPC